MAGPTRKATHAVCCGLGKRGGSWGGGVIWREERSLCPIQELLAEQHNSKPQQIFKDTGTNQKFPNLDWARVINHKRFQSPRD